MFSMLKKKSAIALTFIAILLAVMIGCGNSTAKSDSQADKKAGKHTESQAIATAKLIPADKAQMSPDWTMPGIDEKSYSMSDLKGKIIILDFWDTWCGPCKKEIPGFIELQDTYKDKGVVIVGAAFGKYGKKAVSDFAKQWNINYPVVLADKNVVKSFGGIRSIPTTFIIDQDGKIRSKHVGFATKSQFESEILALLSD